MNMALPRTTPPPLCLQAVPEETHMTATQTVTRGIMSYDARPTGRAPNRAFAFVSEMGRCSPMPFGLPKH